MTPEEAVVDRLLQSDAVTNIVGRRVWLMRYPQNPTLPAMRVQVISHMDGQHLRGPEGNTAARVQVEACVKDDTTAAYGLAEEISEAARTALVFAPFEAGGSPSQRRVVSVERVDRRTFYDPDELRLLRMTQDFMVRSHSVT